MPFKVMTFNIRGALFQDGDNIWRKRADLNVATIQKYDPDLLGFQEYQHGNQETYDQHLTDYDYELGLPSSMEDEYRQFNAIYWKRDRYEKIDSGAFYLSETPDVWSKSWDTAVVRSANWVRLYDTENDMSFIYLNTHLDHISEQARVEGSKLIVQRLHNLRHTLAYPVIVTADFNSPAWDAGQDVLDNAPPPFRGDNFPPAGTVHKVYTDTGYMDTFTAAGNTNKANTNTFHAFHGRGFPAVGLRIDWVLTLDGTHTFTAQACDIITDEAPPVYPSDHYPVLATLDLK